LLNERLRVATAQVEDTKMLLRQNEQQQQQLGDDALHHELQMQKKDREVQEAVSFLEIARLDSTSLLESLRYCTAPSTSPCV